MGEAILSADRICKRFGAVEALSDVSFEVRAGSITGLIGDNGAGKSTMVKILSGIFEPTEGSLRLAGEAITLAAPPAARPAGSETVPQPLALGAEVAVAENFYLGRELSGFWPIRLCQTGRMARQAEESMRNLGINLPGGVRRKVRSMSGGQRQAVAIARASFWQSRLLLLDEPTAALGVRESKQVLELIQRLADNGAAVLLVSHNMDDVAKLCEEAIVLRQGRKVGHLTGGFTSEDGVAYITGARSDLDPAA